MAEKPTRGRRSKVHLLPDDIKQQLDAMLRDGRLQQQEILDVINQSIGKAGLPTDAKLSRTGLNRYSTRMEEVGSRIRQAREVSQQWVATLGTEANGSVSSILVEMIRTLAYETTINSLHSGILMEPKLIKELAVGVERLEKAASENQKRTADIRKQVLEEQRAKLVALGKTGEVDPVVLEKVILAAYGIST